MTAASPANPGSRALNAVSRAYRLQHMGLTVDGQPFDLRKYPYLVPMLDIRAPRKTIIKGGQIGFTTTFVFDCALSAWLENLRGILYLFPTDNDVYDFSRARFSPNIAENAAFASLVDKIDSAGLKKIAGVPIYFRAAGAIGSSTTQSLSKLKSVAVDRLYLDELDEMQASRVDAAERRLDGAREAGIEPEIVSLSTPTVPGFGVDFSYKQSDGGTWHWRCPKCNGWTCLEMTWPDCIAEPTGAEPFYLCSKCHDRLERRSGERVAQRPDLSAEHRGDWISQLCKRSAADVLETQLELVDRRGRPREFYNQVLGRAYASIQDKLTKEMIDDCLTEIPRALRSEGPCCAGADVGKRPIHWWVKQRIGDRDTQTLNYGVCETFAELAEISRKYHVQTGVIDQMAETRKVREFVDAHREWWGAIYDSNKKGFPDWNFRDKIVRVSRTVALDASHAKFVEKREHLPAPNEDYHQLVVPQLMNMARVSKKDEQTGDETQRWVILGGVKNDHFHHAHAYSTLAEERVSLAAAVQRERSSTSDYGQAAVAHF